MEQTVRVLTCDPDGTAQVIHVRKSACSGDCHNCSGCGAAKETLTLTAENPIGAKPGQMVRITSETAPVLKAAMILYLLPIALLIAGYLLLMSQNLGLWGAGIGFLLGVLIVWIYDRKVAAKQKNQYTITAILSGEDKGDNDLD